MTRRDSGTAWYLWLVAVATILCVAGCGGGSGSGGAPSTPRHATSPAPAHSPSTTAAGHTTPSSAAASGKSTCALLSAAYATAALGMAVGKARPAPGENLSNGAVGAGCEWVDSAGGTVALASVSYPSPTIASKEFKGSTTGSAQAAQPLNLPHGLAPSEGGDTASYDGTRIAESFLLDGNRELDVTLNEPTSGPGSRFSLAAYVTLVQQAAQAWR